jgi:hypothetical protein
MKIQASIFIVFAIAIIGGCKSSTTVVDVNTGTLQGKVALSVDCNLLPNASGATVHIEGTGFSETTDSLGDWTMNNVPAGIYNILITKPGFDTDLISQDQFSGAGTQFLENGAISSFSPLLDSVLITSIQITKKDSILWNDTTKMFDTVSYEYFLTASFTMQGPDSAIFFYGTLTDVTHPTSYFQTPDNEIVTPTLSRNASIVGEVHWFTALGLNSIYPAPQPGDSIGVTTMPYSSCRGPAPQLSKGLVLP